MTPEAVLLDSFGTLVWMEPPVPHLRAELAARGVEVSEAQAASAFTAEIAYYLEHNTEGRDAASLDDLRDRCAAALLEGLGVPGVDLRTARAAMLAAIRFNAFSDAAPTLRELRARGMRLVVASNWDCSLPDVLRQAGLHDLVDGVATSAGAGARKPAAPVFLRALEIAGCPPERAVHVGDSPENDVEGAAAAGIRPVLLARDGAGAPTGGAATVIASLADLPRVI
jgi:2-haloalkanoic acid dehalogenase type II